MNTILEIRDALTASHELTARSSVVAQQAGSAVINHEIERGAPTKLPEGYQYADQATLDPADILQLFRQVEMGEHLQDNYMQEQQGMVDSIGAQIFDVGVRDSAEELVGIASVIHKDNSGELINLVVKPAHQSKGIGKALINERIRLAEAAGIDSFYIEIPEPTNSLHMPAEPNGQRDSYYFELGFQSKPNGDMVRGPQPVSYSEML
jgi:GNAT superfamily N-acetyltransferase